MTYKLAAIRSYINRAIIICSTQNLFKKEIKTIQEIAAKLAQKLKPKFTNAITFDSGASLSIKKEAAKFNLRIPIKPNPNIFQRIRNEKEIVNNHETAGIYKINFTDENGKQGSYIGMTKRKIKQRIKEHKDDIRFGRRQPFHRST